MVDVPTVDFGAVFDAVPAPYLVLDPDLRIVAVNSAYLSATARTRRELVGQYLFAAFPDNPDDPDAGATANLGASLRRVLGSGSPDTMPLQKYDVPDGHGGFLRRWWSPVNAPVLDDSRTVVLLLHRVEDVTDFVDAQLAAGRSAADTTGLAAGVALRAVREDLRRTESDLHTRGRELLDALAEQARTAAHLAVMARDARRAARQQGALVATARALGEAHDHDAVLAVVATHSADLLGAFGAGLCLHHSSGNNPSNNFSQDSGKNGGGAGLRVHTTVTSTVDRTPLTRDLPADSPLPAVRTAVTGKPYFLEGPDATAAHFPDPSGTYAGSGIAASASVPLLGHDHLLGSLSVGFADARPWPQHDQDLLVAFAALTTQALERINAREAERAAAAVAARSAETLQRALLTDLPQPDHLQLHARYLPAADTEQVGGDWYDAVVMPDGATTLVIGDVVGHDMASAAQMGQLRSTTRTLAWAFEEPACQILTRVDQAIAGLRMTTLATALLARIEQPDTHAARGLRRLRWSNAGHPPPLLITADGHADYLTRDHDMLLGLQPDAPRHDHLADLPPDSTLLLYTDGLVERRGRTLNDGLEHLRATAETHHHLELTDLVDALLHDLVLHDPAARDPRTSDDVAVLAVRMHPEDRPRPPEAGPGHL